MVSDFYVFAATMKFNDARECINVFVLSWKSQIDFGLV